MLERPAAPAEAPTTTTTGATCATTSAMTFTAATTGAIPISPRQLEEIIGGVAERLRGVTTPVLRPTVSGPPGPPQESTWCTTAPGWTATAAWGLREARTFVRSPSEPFHALAYLLTAFLLIRCSYRTRKALASYVSRGWAALGITVGLMYFISAARLVYMWAPSGPPVKPAPLAPMPLAPTATTAVPSPAAVAHQPATLLIPTVATIAFFLTGALWLLYSSLGRPRVWRESVASSARQLRGTTNGDSDRIHGSVRNEVTVGGFSSTNLPCYSAEMHMCQCPLCPIQRDSNLRRGDHHGPLPTNGAVPQPHATPHFRSLSPDVQGLVDNQDDALEMEECNIFCVQAVEQEANDLKDLIAQVHSGQCPAEALPQRLQQIQQKASALRKNWKPLEDPQYVNARTYGDVEQVLYETSFRGRAVKAEAQQAFPPEWRQLTRSALQAHFRRWRDAVMIRAREAVGRVQTECNKCGRIYSSSQLHVCLIDDSTAKPVVRQGVPMRPMHTIAVTGGKVTHSTDYVVDTAYVEQKAREHEAAKPAAYPLADIRAARPGHMPVPTPVAPLTLPPPQVAASELSHLPPTMQLDPPTPTASPSPASLTGRDFYNPLLADGAPVTSPPAANGPAIAAMSSHSDSSAARVWQLPQPSIDGDDIAMCAEVVSQPMSGQPPAGSQMGQEPIYGQPAQRERAQRAETRGRQRYHPPAGQPREFPPSLDACARCVFFRLPRDQRYGTLAPPWTQGCQRCAYLRTNFRGRQFQARQQATPDRRDRASHNDGDQGRGTQNPPLSNAEWAIIYRHRADQEQRTAATTPPTLVNGGDSTAQSKSPQPSQAIVLAPSCS